MPQSWPTMRRRHKAWQTAQEEQVMGHDYSALCTFRSLHHLLAYYADQEAYNAHKKKFEWRRFVDAWIDGSDTSNPPSNPRTLIECFRLSRWSSSNYISCPSICMASFLSSKHIVCFFFIPIRCILLIACASSPQFRIGSTRISDWLQSAGGEGMIAIVFEDYYSLLRRTKSLNSVDPSSEEK